MSEIKLYGRVFISGKIKAVTGLHIGGSEGAISIGGVDNTVIRDPLTQQPYIHGSSLKGKMRSLLEKSQGRPQNQSIGRDVNIHVCQSADAYETCDVCHIYGVPAEVGFSQPTRLIVRDVMLNKESVQKLDKAKTDLPYTEVKWEVGIDRVTSAANPRQMERVPAGAEFGKFEMVFSIYGKGDVDRFTSLISSMSLLEDDYLGGSGSRGSGKIAFKQLRVTLKRSDDYLNPTRLGQKDKPYLSLNKLSKDLEMIRGQLTAVLEG